MFFLSSCRPTSLRFHRRSIVTSAAKHLNATSGWGNPNVTPNSNSSAFSFRSVLCVLCASVVNLFSFSFLTSLLHYFLTSLLLFAKSHPDTSRSSPPTRPAAAQTPSRIFPSACAPQIAAPDSVAPPSTALSSAPKSHTFAAHKSPAPSRPLKLRHLPNPAAPTRLASPAAQ